MEDGEGVGGMGCNSISLLVVSNPETFRGEHGNGRHDKPKLKKKKVNK
jgi:hypothetical protein